MRHEISGTIEYEGDRYGYDATIYTGDEANFEYDEVTSIDCEGDCLHVWECDDLIDLIKDDANERVNYQGPHDPIKDEETLCEYLVRMAEVWHPEELI